MEQVLRLIDRVGPDRFDRADPRRERHRQGADRRGRARALEPQQPKPFVKLNCAAHSRNAARVGAVRPREGRVHRRGRPQARQVRAGRRRHAAARRDRRHDAGDAGQDPARAAGARVPARRRHADDQGGRPHPRVDQQGPREGGQARARSATTCTSVSTSSRSTCRRCAIAATRSRSWPITSSPRRTRDSKRSITRLAPDTLAALMEYGWPGNVRELRNMIERAVVVNDGDVLALSSFPPPIRPAEPPASAARDDGRRCRTCRSTRRWRSSSARS